MDISAVYAEYSIPINLQNHMLRVAALGSLICDQLDRQLVDKDLIVKTLLLHDMGNILKYNFSRIDLFDEADRKNIEKYKKVQRDFEARYGSDPDAIQQYRERFIELAVKIAEGIGEVESVNIDYGELTFVPEDLEREGFTDIKWIKGNWGQRKGFGQEQVMARKDNMTVVLTSGNSLVPWKTLARYNLTEDQRENLAKHISDELLYL